MSKRFLISFVVGLALIVVGSVGAARLKQRDKDQAEFQAELEGATPMQGTVLTERQRMHSKLFNGFRLNEERIRDLIAPYKGKKIVYGISVSYRMAEEFNNSETPEGYLGKLTRESDVVVRGKVADKASELTDDGNFIFTDYSVLVKEVLKNNEKAPLSSGTTITVTSPGGKVLIADVIVKTSSNGFGVLPINNHYVVLFLTFLPETGDYRLTRYNGAFELDGTSVRPIASQFSTGFFRDRDSFLETARAVTSK